MLTKGDGRVTLASAKLLRLQRPSAKGVHGCGLRHRVRFRWAEMAGVAVDYQITCVGKAEIDPGHEHIIS